MGFYERYVQVCKQFNLEPCAQSTADLFNISRSTISSWNVKGTAPKGETVAAIANALGVSTDYLLGRTDDPRDFTNAEMKNSPGITEGDKRDIARSIEQIMDDLANSGELMFDGVPMSEEAKAAMAAAMRIGFEEARRRNKETYTPKKYRKE